MKVTQQEISDYNEHAQSLLQQLIDENENRYSQKIVFDNPEWIQNPDIIMEKLNYPDSSAYSHQKKLMEVFSETEICRNFMYYLDRPFPYNFYSFPIFSKKFGYAYLEIFKRFAQLVGHGDNAIYKKEINGVWKKFEITGNLIS